MRPPRTVSVALFLILLVTGCKPAQPIGSAKDDPDVPDVPLAQFSDAIRLTNGTVNLVIVPSLGGRIMRYGFVGEPNVLWNNPDIPDLSKGHPDYFNYGGDKAWPWPQDDWPLLIGRNFPPPPECDQAVFKSRLIGSHGVRLESPTIPSHAARIVREIALEPAGTRVTIVTRLELASGERPPPSMAAWTVTQVPGDREIFARMLPDGGYESMRPELPTATTRPLAGGAGGDAPRAIAIEKTTPKSSKTGLDADILAAVSGNTLFVERSPTAAQRSDKYRAAERAQLFIQQADPPKRDVPRYIELEFTSPREDLAGGRSPEQRITWELHRTDKPWTDQSIAAILLNDPPESANPKPASAVP
jgi:hypothetical protein